VVLIHNGEQLAVVDGWMSWLDYGEYGGIQHTAPAVLFLQSASHSIFVLVILVE
jgi:hypothetical protein